MIQEKEPVYFAEFRKEITSRFDGMDKQFEVIDKRFNGIDKTLKEISETLETHFEAIGEVKVQISDLESSQNTKAIKNIETRTKILEDLLLAA
jgi:uncharacterized protein YoxC